MNAFVYLIGILVVLLIVGRKIADAFPNYLKHLSGNKPKSLLF